jgi:hypothetical protein
MISATQSIAVHQRPVQEVDVDLHPVDRGRRRPAGSRLTGELQLPHVDREGVQLPDVVVARQEAEACSIQEDLVAFRGRSAVEVDIERGHQDVDAGRYDPLRDQACGVYQKPVGVHGTNEPVHRDVDDERMPRAVVERTAGVEPGPRIRHDRVSGRRIEWRRTGTQHRGRAAVRSRIVLGDARRCPRVHCENQACSQTQKLTSIRREASHMALHARRAEVSGRLRSAAAA